MTHNFFSIKWNANMGGTQALEALLASCPYEVKYYLYYFSEHDDSATSVVGQGDRNPDGHVQFEREFQL